MTEYALILVSTVLVNNFVLVKFLGLCPFMGVSRKLETAAGMGLATTFVLTLSSVASYLINHFLLAPLGLEYLRTIAFILAIAAVVQFTEMVVHKTSPLLYQVLGIFLPLITTNCAVLGVALLNTQLEHGFLQSAIYGFGAAAGFSLPAGARLPAVSHLRVRRRGRILPGAGAVRGGARAGRRRRRARGVPGERHRTHHRRAHVPGVHGLRRAGKGLTPTA